MPRDIFRLGYSIRMEADQNDTAEMMLYGEIVEDGPKWWKWSDEDKSAAEFDKAIKEIRGKGAKKLLLRINSPGGVCTQSVSMRAILANAGFEEINIRIEGMCASAATDIATLPGAHVSICEGSEYMIHNPWCCATGNANDLEHTIERLRNIEQVSRGFYAKRTGQSEDQIKAWMDAETWFTAEKAVEYGFADEVLEAEVGKETPAAACVSAKTMNVMRSMYRAVPEHVTVKSPVNWNPTIHLTEDEIQRKMVISANDISNAAPVAGAATEINEHEEEQDTMDIRDINLEQLRAENPALLEQIQQDAVAAERQRREDIDALTIPGYEAMAAEAIANGTSAMDFQRQVVQAQRQRGANYMAARQQETAPAQGIAGDAAGEEQMNDEQAIKQYAADVAKYAKEYRGAADGTMF